MQKGKSRSAPDAYLVGPGSFPQTYQQNCENPMGALQSTAYDANAALAICRGAGSALGRRFGGGSSHPRPRWVQVLLRLDQGTGSLRVCVVFDLHCLGTGN